LENDKAATLLQTFSTKRKPPMKNSLIWLAPAVMTKPWRFGREWLGAGFAEPATQQVALVAGRRTTMRV